MIASLSLWERVRVRGLGIRQLRPSAPPSPCLYTPKDRGSIQRSGGFGLASSVDVFKLTRELIDIPSVTGEEFHIGTSLAELLNRRGYQVDLQEIENDRANLIATTGEQPKIVLSTHMDTVPPYFAASEDDKFIYG